MVIRSFIDRILSWCIAAAVFAAAIFPRVLHWGHQESMYGWIIALAVSLVMFALTSHAKPFLSYVKASYREWMKIHWTSRSETTQLTIVVAIVVICVSIALSLFDNLLSWLFRLLIK